MRLYLLSQVSGTFLLYTGKHIGCTSRVSHEPLIQVEEAAHKKHGGPEGLEEQRRTQLGAKVKKRVEKRKEDSRKVL